VFEEEQKVTSYRRALRQQPAFKEISGWKKRYGPWATGYFTSAFVAGDKKLVLRLAKVECGFQSQTEAVAALRSQS
jgi:hypothetical protein